MKYALILSIFLTGCTVLPVESKFPDVPDILKQKCPELKKLNDDAKLSDVAKTITENYTTYNECAIKVDEWNEWYNSQKKIFENNK